MIYIVYCFPVFRGFYVLLLLQIYCYIISLSIHNFFCKLCFSNSGFRAKLGIHHIIREGAFGAVLPALSQVGRG